MAISEAKALMDLLKMAVSVATGIHTGYYRASNAMRDFPAQVDRLKEIATEWEELLKKVSLPADCPVQARLEASNRLLVEEVERMEQMNRSCCSLLCNKVAFPDRLTSNMNLVIQSFDDIPKSLRERRERDQLVEYEANRVLAPFSFSFDDKYVPIKQTVMDLRGALEGDTSRHNVVLLHGESGQGKTTMAKYLALLYHQESSLSVTSSSTPSQSKYFHKIHFFVCGKNADSTILMKKLWNELGYHSLDELVGMPPVMEGARGDHPAMAKLEIETTRRKIMARLENQERMLIVLEDVWEQSVVEDLHISHKSIKYLITTQNSHLWSDVIRSVQIANPTAEEATNILANHIVGWDLGESFPPEVQKEVDRLVEEVDRKPFILATMATKVRSKRDAMDPRTWKTLRRDLVATLKQLDESRSNPTVFGESYRSNVNVEATMTMAIDSFTDKTQTLFFLVVLFTEEVREVEETVLQVLFRAICGSLINFRSSFQHLTDSYFVLINSKEVSWRQKPFIRWSTHDLRRRFASGMKQAVNVIQKLVSLEQEIHSDEDEQELSVAICYLYGNKHCRELALTKCKFEICAHLLRDEKDESWINENAIAFVRSWVLLLTPDYDDDEVWEKQKHEAAKKVILHLLKFGELHDEEVASLLGDPLTRLDTCYVLSSYTSRSCAPGQTSIPMTVTTLLGEVKHLLCMKDVSVSILGVMTDAMESILVSGADAGVHKHVDSIVMTDILKGCMKMLVDGSNPECHKQVAQAMQVFTISREISKILLVCTEAIDMLVGLINQKTSLVILRMLTNTFYNILSHGMEIEEAMNSDFISRLLEKYIAMEDSAYKLESTRALSQFCWNRWDIVELLMKRLVSGGIDTLVLLGLINKNSQSSEVWVVGAFFYRILVKSEAVDVKFQRDVQENIISAVLKCFLGIFMDGMKSESRIEALLQLSGFAESEEIRKLIVVDSGMIEKIGGLLQDDVSSSDLRILTNAIYKLCVLTALVDLRDNATLRALTSILETYVGFLSLPCRPDDAVKQIEAVRALGLFAARDEIRTLLLADLKLQDTLGGLLRIRKDVSPLLLREVVNLLFSFFIERTKLEGKNDLNSPLLRKAVESFSRTFKEDFKPGPQSEAIRGLGMLAARQDIRELIVGYQGALKRSVELLRATATSSILVDVRDAVDLISAKGPNPDDLDEDTAEFRSAALRGYVALLRDDVPMHLQRVACRALSELLAYKGNRRLFTLDCPDGHKTLKFVVDREDENSSHWPYNCRFFASVALTLIDPFEDSELKQWPERYLGRGTGQMILGMFENAVVDFDKAMEMIPNFSDALSRRAAARVQLGNVVGALEDLNQVLLLKKNRFKPFYWQERGVVKRIMGDHGGALADFNQSLALGRNDYEVLKHRGCVKFLLGDEAGARADAERAIVFSTLETIRPYSIIERSTSLGYWPVDFLGFQLSTRMALQFTYKDPYRRIMRSLQLGIIRDVESCPAVDCKQEFQKIFDIARTANSSFKWRAFWKAFYKTHLQPFLFIHTDLVRI